MNSPIFEFLASYGIDPAWIVIVLLIIVIGMMILYFRILSSVKRLYRKYDRFMRGRDMESLEETIWKQFDRIERLEASDKKKEEEIDRIFENLKIVYQKKGLVKYDAFREMSGKLSYALALLDQEDNGILISSMYSREGCYSYAKNIVHGESAINLSQEEEKALNLAINGDKIEE